MSQAKPKFSQMSSREKTVFILKLTACILSFGMLFPNIMSE